MIAYGDLLLSGREPIEEYDRLKGVVRISCAARPRRVLRDCARTWPPDCPLATIDDLLANPQFIAREYWQTIEDRELGLKSIYPGPFARFGKTPIAYRRRPPRIGEHNREIFLDDLGLSAREFDDFRARESSDGRAITAR